MDNNSEMNIKYIAIKDLKPYAKNAKQHPKEQIERVANSLKEFGWKQPLVVDKDNNIIAGHCRHLAAKQLSKTDKRFLIAPCIVADDLTDEGVKAYRLVDNKTNESPWDFFLMDEELQEIESMDMSLFGFDLFAMDEIAEPSAYNAQKSDKEYFEKTFVFPIERKQQITNYLKKHYDEVISRIISDAEEGG